jgi:hypothetical protein
MVLERLQSMCVAGATTHTVQKATTAKAATHGDTVQKATTAKAATHGGGTTHTALKGTRKAISAKAATNGGATAHTTWMATAAKAVTNGGATTRTARNHKRRGNNAHRARGYPYDACRKMVGYVGDRRESYVQGHAEPQV